MANKKADLSLKYLLYIYYPLYFKKDKGNIKALINSNNKVNIIVLTYMAKLGLKIWLTNVSNKKINSSTFKIFGIVLANF